jgi:hypothetical protein
MVHKVPSLKEGERELIFAGSPDVAHIAKITIPLPF